MKPVLALVPLLLVAGTPVLAEKADLSFAQPGVAPLEITQLVAASWSCSPRKTCGRIRSCDEAYWYYFNCSWGGRLDGDNDGVPCESICY